MSLLKFKRNQKARSFLFFLLLAALIWFLTKFSKPLVAEYRLNLEYINMPKQTLVSSQAPDELLITVNANGFKLLREFFRDKTLVLDLSAGRAIDDNRIRFNQDQLLAFCYRKIPSAEVISVELKELIIPVDQMAAKTIQVVFQGEVSLVQGFKIIDRAEIQPTEITIYGPSQLIDSISSVNTVYTRLNNLRSDLAQSIALEPLWSNKLSRSQDSVLWSARVLEFTQKQIELPVELINGLSVEIPVSEYAQYDKSNFRIVCDYNERISEDSFMIPRLSNLPDGVYKPELSHKKVDYVEFTK